MGLVLNESACPKYEGPWLKERNSPLLTEKYGQIPPVPIGTPWRLSQFYRPQRDWC